MPVICFCICSQCLYFVQVESFPVVHITAETLRKPALPCETAQSAFLQHKETFWQRIQTAWYVKMYIENIYFSHAVLF